MPLPLIETVTIEVGAAIAKSILQLWVKDIPIASNTSASFIDILKSRTSDTIAQRRAQRQFEAIGERVGESLFPLFESEGGHLREESRTTVALAVAETFKKVKISSELLAERNLDPTKLEKYVLSIDPNATNLFSELEQTLYLRIVKESCQC